jgi:hypothetical protein
VAAPTGGHADDGHVRYASVGAHHRLDATECNHPGDTDRVLFPLGYCRQAGVGIASAWNVLERRPNGRRTAMYIGGGIIGLILLILLILWLTGNL